MQTLFSRSPWERASVGPLHSPMMGQTSPGCEPTPEGGYRCPDGTYLPPGCAQGSPQAIQGKPQASTAFPIVPIALTAAAVGAVGYLALSGRQLGAEPETFAPIYAKLDELSTSIKAERAADAWNFSQYIEKGKENLDLLDKERQAEHNLSEQTMLWEKGHHNADALQAAQTNLDSIQSRRGNLKAEIEDFRYRIDKNAQNVVYLRQQALALIDSLPMEIQEDARKKIEPCYKNPTMKGAFLGQVRLGQYGAVENGGGYYSWNGYGSQTPEQRLLQNAQESMNTPPPPTPEQTLLHNAQESMNAQANAGSECYTCANGGDIRSGVDAATAANLKAQGFRCRKDECAQHQQAYGAGVYNGYNPFGNPMATAAPVTSQVSNQNYGQDYGTQNFAGGGGMMEGRRYRVVNT